MAFQAGIIKISGTLDDLSFYHSVFGWLIRTKGGPTRKQFKTSPSFARSRENSDEFVTCARAAASIRQLVLNYTGNKDKTLYHRLMKLMRLLANDDNVSRRGARDPLKGMLTTQGRHRLRHFEITGGLSLHTVLVTTNFFTLPEERQKKQCQHPPESATIKKKKKLCARNAHSQKQRHFVMRQLFLVPSCTQRPGSINTAFG